jgi:hypothetical protein
MDRNLGRDEADDAPGRDRRQQNGQSAGLVVRGNGTPATGLEIRKEVDRELSEQEHRLDRVLD